MADTLTKHFGDRISVDVTPGMRGMFDVKVGDELLFSRYTEHRFPDDDEIVAAVAGRLD